MTKQIFMFLCCYAAAATLSAQLNNALIAKYYFNAANAHDDHTGGYHATVTGASLTHDRFGNADKAYYFDGIDDFMTLGDQPFRMGTSDFSFSFWIQVQDPLYCVLFSKRYRGDNSDMRFRQYNVLLTQAATFATSGTSLWGYEFIQASGACYDKLSDELSKAWHHVVVNFRHGVEMQCYVDNVLTYSALSTTCTESFDVETYPLVVGYRQIEEDLFFKGKLDDIRIYRRALTVQEVDTLYREGNPATIGVAQTTQEQAQFVAYPNPTIDGNLQFDRLATTADLYDATGKLLLRAQNTQTLSLRTLPQGIYFLHLQAENGKIHRQKIIYTPQ